MKYLVLGGNAAGLSFAAKIKRNDPNCEIVVIEKRNYVSFGACGLPYYIAGYVDEVDELIVRDTQSFIDSGIDIRTEQEVVDVISEKKQVKIMPKNNDEYYETYDKLIIASGASPINPFNINIDLKKVFTLVSKEDGSALKQVVENNKNKKFGIIGSGFIGLELMDALIEQNHNVNIITNESSIMSRIFDYEVIKDIQEDIQNHSQINLYLDESVTNVDVKDDVIVVKTKKEELEFDYLILAVGFKPNSSFINNVEKLPNGAIIVDENMQTSQKDIYAMGDVATINNLVTNQPMYVPLATTANKAGRALADIVTRKENPFKGMLGASIIKILDYELARVGITEKEAQDLNISFKTEIVEDFNQTSHYVGQSKIVVKIYYDPTTKIILGIEMAGKKGVHGRVNVISVAISKKMTTKELGYIDFAYAPPFSRTWDILNVVGNVCK